MNVNFQEGNEWFEENQQQQFLLVSYSQIQEIHQLVTIAAIILLPHRVGLLTKSPPRQALR
jgi:hypothetical protein